LLQLTCSYVAKTLKAAHARFGKDSIDVLEPTLDAARCQLGMHWPVVILAHHGAAAASNFVQAEHLLTQANWIVVKVRY
jgi:hypothetical protein